MKVDMVDLKWCEFYKAGKRLSLASEFCGMPSQIDVRSQTTGKIVRFVAVQPGDPWYDQDNWDGEQMVYRPTTPVPNVEKLVIYHAY